MVGAQQATEEPSVISVMLVDDSAVIRGMVSRALSDNPDIEVVATASDGEMALRVLERHQVDVIVLDIEMPRMDGMTALPKLLEKSPDSKIIMASTLTTRNAEISIKAMSIGAADYLGKPTSEEGKESRDIFFRELNAKIMALGGKELTRELPLKTSTISNPPPAQTTVASASIALPEVSYPEHPIKAIAIASSTGGPQALQVVLEGIKQVSPKLPIYITQHMPATFTKLLANHLTKDTSLDCVEAEDGMMVRAGQVYIAPGDYHMVPETSGTNVRIVLNQDPPVNFCRPAADPMLDSLANIYGKNLLTIVLTGMGSDGCVGAEQCVAKGGAVIAQDEKSSVVWGMPRAVAKANLCKAVLSLKEIPDYVIKAAGR